MEVRVDKDRILSTIMEDSREMRATSALTNNANEGQYDETIKLLPNENYSKMPKFSGETQRADFQETQSAYTGVALTNRDLEIVRAEMAKGQFTLSGRDKFISWMVLIVLLLAQISNQWQRFMISAAYNYTMPEGEEDDPYYMMSVDIPNFTADKYGLLSGVMFTSLFSITVLFSGVLSDNCSRRLLLSFAAMLWSVTSLTTAVSTDYTEVALSRMMLGFFEAFCGPPAYSLIVDYFPPEVRTTANAIYAFGIYVGNALSSMIIIMISTLGWRWAYAITGFVGIVIGILVLLLVKDPIRGRFEPRLDIAKVDNVLIDEEEEEGGSHQINNAQPVPAPQNENLCFKYLGGFKAMYKNNVCFYVTIGACFRFWQGYSIAYFALKFFSDYGHNNIYGLLNGLSVMIGGFTSQLVGGLISDRFEGRYPRTKPFVAMTMSLLGVVTTSCCFMFTFNFYWSISFLFLTYLLAEGWMSPAVAMIQASIDVRYKGVAMGVFLFATAIFGTIGTLVIGTLIEDFHIQSQAKKGWLLTLNTAIPCLFAALFFYISSIHYAKFRKSLGDQKEDAMEKASQYQFEDNNSVGDYGYFKMSSKGPATNDVAGSYRYVHRPNFGVVRDASSSIQPMKSRPLLVSKEIATDETSVNKDDHDNQALRTQSMENRPHQGLELNKIKSGQDDLYANF